MPIEARVHFFSIQAKSLEKLWPRSSLWSCYWDLAYHLYMAVQRHFIKKSDPIVHNVSSHTVWAQRSLEGFASSTPSSQPTLSSSALMAKALLTVGTNEARPMKTRSEHRSKCLDLSSRTFDVFLAPYAKQTVSGQTPILCDMGE